MLLRANTLAKGSSGARIETVELLLACLEPRRAAGRAEPRLASARRGDLAPLAHLALPLVGEGEAFLEGERLPGLEALAARRARAGAARRRRRGCRSSTARSSWPRSARSGSCAHGGSRAPPTSHARSRSRRCRARARPSCPRSTRCARCAARDDSAANVLRLLEGSAIIESHRWCDKVQDAYSLRCAPQVHGASRDLLDYVDYTVSVELNAATDNPLVLVDEDALVSNGNFHGQPLAFALDALAMARRRAREHLGAPRRAARQPEPLRRAAGVPHRRRRAQLRVHDPAVRGRVARLREQGARPSRVGRLDPDERRAGGPRVDGERSRAEGVAGARELRARGRDRAARRRAGRSSSSRRSSPGPACARRAPPCAGCRRGCATTARSRRDIEAVATAIRDGSIVAAVEPEIGELR